MNFSFITVPIDFYDTFYSYGIVQGRFDRLLDIFTCLLA